MNYSKKHIKKLAYNKMCGYSNRIVYLYSDTDEASDEVPIPMRYKALCWTTARHYSNTKKCYRW